MVFPDINDSTGNTNGCQTKGRCSSYSYLPICPKSGFHKTKCKIRKATTLQLAEQKTVNYLPNRSIQIASSNTMNYPSTAITILEALYQHGTDICAEIEKFQPDLVIGLAHSGWMPVVVAQELWAQTRKTTSPPSTRTNIGLEKHKIYTARFGNSPPAFCCGTCSWESDRLGHYLAWAAEQTGWLETLRAQIEQVYSGIPARILVVDDLFGGYRSGFAVLALLYALYPQVETYVFAGHTDLTDTFVIAWMEGFVPELLTDEDKNPGRYTRYKSPWHELLKPLINGTEDITPDRLDWRYLSPESPAVKALVEYLPVETILAAPTWAKTLACTYALERLQGEFSGSVPIVPEDDEHFISISHLSLSAEDRLAARAWQRNGVDWGDLVEIFGDSLGGMKRGLKAVAKDYEWHRHGRRKDAFYFPILALETWMNAYDIRSASVGDPGKQVYGFDKFLPGQLWAGGYPIASDSRVKDQPFRDLLSAGVDTYISLINSEDAHNKWPYRKVLHQIYQESNKKIRIHVFPLPFQTSPTRAEMEKVLKKINRELKAGKRIYLHAGHNQEGRTPMVLACLLIQQGYSFEQALARVDDFWLKTLPFLIRNPLTEAQLQFIRGWVVR